MMNETVNSSTFGLKGKHACISGMKNKEKYMEYQNNYREIYGVYPELDRIHNPYTARWDNVYQLCCSLRKSGVYGALYYHDLHNRYRRRLKRIYENYSKEWSFLISIDLEYRTTLSDIQSMSPTKNIVNDLGVQMVTKTDNMVKFKNSLPADELIKSIAKHKIDDILIAEATLEDIFLHYYK